MTTEELIKEVRKQLSDAKILQQELTKELKDLSPFKVGDKVLADGKTCYVREVIIRHDGSYDYSFAVCKKDGTMGQGGAGVYYPKTIELCK